MGELAESNTGSRRIERLADFVANLGRFIAPSFLINGKPPEREPVLESIYYRRQADGGYKQLVIPTLARETFDNEETVYH